MAIEVRIKAVYEEFLTSTKLMGSLFGGVMDGMKSELKSMSDQAKTDLKGHESATEQFASVVKSNFKGVNGAIEGVKIAWAQLAVVIGAGAMLKGAITDTVKWTDDSQALGRALGVSATQASILKVAIQGIGGTTADYLALSKGLTNELARHELAMNKAGLATRDSSGHLKDQQTLVLDAMQTLRTYKEGTDRNIVAQTLFGRSVNTSSEVLQLNKQAMEDAAAEAAGLNLIVGKEGSQAVEEYKKAMAGLDGIMLGMKITIVEALMPSLNDTSNWFRESGPNAIIGFKAALNTVLMLIHGLVFAAKIMVEVFKAAFNSLLEDGGQFARVFGMLISGNFAGAAVALETQTKSTQQNFTTMFNNIVNDAESTNASLTALWKNLDPKPVTDSGTSGGGTGTVEPPEAKASNGAARRAAAEAKRRLKEAYDAQMEAYRGEEQAAKGHFDTILEIQRKELAAAIGMYGEKSKQAQAVENRIAETQRQAAEQQDRLNAMRAESDRNLALARIDVEERLSSTRQQIGAITIEQLLALEVGYEARRYEIKMQGLQDDLVANTKRVEEHAQTLIKMKALDAAHQANIAEIGNQATIAAANQQEQQAQMLGQAFDNSINGMISKTITLQQALAQIFIRIAQSFIQQEGLKLARFLTGQTAMTGANLAGNGVRVAADITAAKMSGSASAQTATKSILNSAASVFGKVYDAIAGIPYVGPFLAPVMAIAATGAVVGYVSKVASAEGGFDIPAGVNPMTQLHEKEMVLPAKHADVIRGMANEEGTQKQGDQHFHVHATDTRGFEKLLRDNAATLTKVLRQQHANG